MLRMLKRIAVGALALIVLLCAAGLGYRAYVQHSIRESTRITAPEGIESLERIRIGGVDQWVLIRGRDRRNPVMLYLHGGPGAPIIPSARDVGVKAGLEQHFVMVYWDQRGSGKSFDAGVPASAMTIDQFVADAHDLTELLRQRFNAPKIYLLGRSWGSIIGVLTAQRYPDLFYAYIGVGQVVNVRENERLSYQFALDRARATANQQAIQDLTAIGAPPYDYKKLLVERKWVRAFGGLLHEQGQAEGFVNLGTIGLFAATPEYSLGDLLNSARDPYYSLRLLWNDKLLQVDLFSQAPILKVPVYLLEGRYDETAPSSIAERYYQQLQAPQKALIWFDDSAHMVEFEQPQPFADALVGRVLRETYRAPSS